MLLALTGAEKVGKTTLSRSVAEACRGDKWHVVHLGARRPHPLDLTVYLDCLKMAARTDTLVIMDRGWADEVVYSQLIPGRRAAGTAPALEWHLGRAVPTLGVGLLVTVANTLAAQERRDETDYLIRANVEIFAFEDYAQHWNWNTTQSDAFSTFQEWVERTTEDVMQELRVARDRMLTGLVPPFVAGDVTAPLLAVVGEQRNDAPKRKRPLDWLPFTGPTEWVRDFCPHPWNRVLWTNARDAEENEAIERLVWETPRALLMGGRAPETFAGHPGAVHIPHPSALRRWGTMIEQWNDDRIKDTWNRAAFG